MSRISRLAAAALLGCAAWLATGAAAAQSSSMSRFQGDWRRANRDKPDDALFTPGRFTFEVGFGPYYPQIDDEFGGAATPYADVFNTNPQFYVGLELDWLPFRIPYLGVLGPGLGWGYTWASATAKVADTGADSAQETSLWIMPMHASAVLRVDVLMREAGVPFVPFAKVGFGMGLWSAGRGEDTSEVDGTTGKGSSFGTHLALGGMFSLSWLDRRSTGSLNDSTGIERLYIYGEWMNASLGSGDQMRVGTSTWVLGLAGDL